MRLFLSPQDNCSYLPDRESTSLFVDPDEMLDMRRYSALVRAGFRRSGRYVYRPHCETCHACVPARIAVEPFRPSRSQRRNQRMNTDVTTNICTDLDSDVQYRRYVEYQRRRHPGGTMEKSSRAEFTSFLTAHWAETELREFIAADESLGVCVYDVLDDGLSAVYTFYSDEGEQRAIGKYAVLWMIEEARRRGLAHVYLGYWIADCRKMAYKADFDSLEVLLDGTWVDLSAELSR